MAAIAAASCSFIATPAPAHLDSMLDAVKVSAASHGFAADLALAHAEALRRGVPVTMCKSADGERCAAGSWSRGWIVFVDADGNARRSPGEEIVLRERALSRSLHAAGTLEGAHAVAFGASGESRLAGRPALAAATLTVCRDGGAGARRVTLQPGRSLRVLSEAAAGCA